VQLHCQFHICYFTSSFVIVKKPAKNPLIKNQQEPITGQPEIRPCFLTELNILHSHFTVIKVRLNFFLFLIKHDTEENVWQEVKLHSINNDTTWRWQNIFKLPPTYLQDKRRLCILYKQNKLCPCQEMNAGLVTELQRLINTNKQYFARFYPGVYRIIRC
jgi:hypothetical protein